MEDAHEPRVRHPADGDPAERMLVELREADDAKPESSHAAEGGEDLWTAAGGRHHDQIRLDTRHDLPKVMDLAQYLDSRNRGGRGLVRDHADRSERAPATLGEDLDHVSGVPAA